MHKQTCSRHVEYRKDMILPFDNVFTLCAVPQ